MSLIKILLITIILLMVLIILSIVKIMDYYYGQCYTEIAKEKCKTENITYKNTTLTNPPYYTCFNETKQIDTAFSYEELLKCI